MYTMKLRVGCGYWARLALKVGNRGSSLSPSNPASIQRAVVENYFGLAGRMLSVGKPRRIKHR